MWEPKLISASSKCEGTKQQVKIPYQFLHYPENRSNPPANADFQHNLELGHPDTDAGHNYSLLPMILSNATATTMTIINYLSGCIDTIQRNDHIITCNSYLCCHTKLRLHRRMLLMLLLSSFKTGKVYFTAVSLKNF